MVGARYDGLARLVALFFGLLSKASLFIQKAAILFSKLWVIPQSTGNSSPLLFPVSLSKVSTLECDF